MGDGLCGDCVLRSDVVGQIEVQDAPKETLREGDVDLTVDLRQLCFNRLDPGREEARLPAAKKSVSFSKGSMSSLSYVEELDTSALEGTLNER